jgi:hypothetical protein
MVHGAEFFGADGMIITGSATGRSASLDDIAAAAGATDRPVVVGSGVTAANVREMLAAAKALRRARRRSADPVAVALSRARLAAMRRGHAAGRAILARAIERHPSDERLRAAWRMAAGSAGSGAKPRCA